ncbi:MAG: hypothetical protein ACYC27_10300 [Armatimonadota bacterium]
MRTTALRCRLSRLERTLKKDQKLEIEARYCIDDKDCEACRSFIKPENRLCEYIPNPNKQLLKIIYVKDWRSVD